MEVNRIIGHPRIFLYGTTEFIDLTYPVDVEPDQNRPQIFMSRSNTAHVQTTATHQYAFVRLVQDEMPREEAFALMRIHDDHLSFGKSIGFIRDTTKFFYATFGNRRAEDSVSGLRPSFGSKWSFTPFHNGRNKSIGAVGVFDDSSVFFGYTNVIPNGDFLDTPLYTQPEGWAKSSNLSAVADVYLCPDDFACMRISESGSPGYPARVSYEFEWYQPIRLIEAITLSWMQRADRGAQTASTLWEIRLVRVSDLSFVTAYVGTPSTTWEPKAFTFNNPWEGEIGEDTTLKFELYINSRLSSCTPYITGVQVEDSKYATGFLPRSPTRPSSGVRSGESLRYLNLYELFYKTPVINPGYTTLPPYPSTKRIAFTISSYIVQGWHTFNMPNNGNCPFLTSVDLFSQSGGNTFRFFFRDFNDVVVNLPIQAGGLKEMEALLVIPTQDELSLTHIMFTWLDYDPVGPENGEWKIIVNGTVVASGTHTDYVERLGQVFKVGEDKAATFRTNAWFHDFRVNPVYVSNSYTGTFDAKCVKPISDYYSTTTYNQLIERERNAFKLRLDPRQDDNIVRCDDNSYRLDGRFQEEPWL